MRRGLVAVVAALLVLAWAPAARADVTIGSALAQPPDVELACEQTCTLAPATIPARALTAPAAGVVTRWRVATGAAVTPMRLRVIERDQINGTAAARASSAEVTPAANRVSVFPTRLPIAAGETIGIDTGTAMIARSDPAAVVDIWATALGGNQSAPTAQDTLELLINADVEPDADGDGYGDETQDNCPTANPGQEDLDGDGQGDDCDVDDDGDGADDATDNCDRAANPSQADADGDGQGDACDGDRDGDAVANGVDVCPDLAAATANGCPAPPAAPRVNTPPVVRFRAPMSGTAVRVSQAIELEVADDAGEPRVTVFDDDGTICALSGPPYSCTWSPTGADVGRATLLASAVDSDNRSTLGIVRVRVSRFEADLTRRVRGRRVSGRLVLPAAVERSLGCRGKVTVRRGKARRTVALKRNCRYSARLPTRRGKARARFTGNSVVEPAT